MVILIGILGQSHSGKTTLARLIEEQFDDDESRCRRVAFAEPLKEEVAKLNNIPINELYNFKEKYRPQLIKVGQAKRAIDPDHWAKLWADKVADLVNEEDVTDCIIADDVRFSNEVDALLSIDAGLPESERIITQVILVSLYVGESLRRKRGCKVFNDPTEKPPQQILLGSTCWPNSTDYLSVSVESSEEGTTHSMDFLTPGFLRNALQAYANKAVKQR
jgi:hypothetical protein